MGSRSYPLELVGSSGELKLQLYLVSMTTGWEVGKLPLHFSSPLLLRITGRVQQGSEVHSQLQKWRSHLPSTPEDSGS